MASNRHVAVVVGSLREGSLNRRVAGAMIALAPAHLNLEMVEIGTLPLYNEDLDGPHRPSEWAAFRDQVKAADAVLFVTPEYNRSIPGGLKNAIDVGSRPYGQSAWARKPAAVASATPGGLGAFGANHHLRQSAVFLDLAMMPQPEAYFSHVDKWFAEDGSLADDKAKELLTKFMAAFADWIEKLLKGPGALS